MSTWKPCPACFDVVRPFRNGACEECGYTEKAETPAPVCEETLDIFATPSTAPSIQGNANSEAAAAKVAPALSHKRRDLLVWMLRNRMDGVTDNEAIAALTAKGWSVNGIRNRRVELHRGGWVEECGNRDGSAIWRPTGKAMRWFEETLREGRAA